MPEKTLEGIHMETQISKEVCEISDDCKKLFNYILECPEVQQPADLDDAYAILWEVSSKRKTYETFGVHEYKKLFTELDELEMKQMSNEVTPWVIELLGKGHVERF